MIYTILLYSWIGLAILLFPILLRITAPYGRHTKSTWGPLVSNRWGWVIMELPALLIFPILFFVGDGPKTYVTWLFLGLWLLHYTNRTLVFPLRTRTKGKKMPLTIVLMAICFNGMNGYLNGYYMGFMADYGESYLADPRMMIGFAIFAVGLLINWQSDAILLNLRKPGETGYKIPKKGLFRYISCPNHLGEIIEWAGFAVMTWSLPTLSFALWTAVNLIPRALDHHRWYRKKFPDYPKERKAIIPFLW